jgi:hypothetical protein
MEQPVTTKYRKVRSERQLKALENARQKADKVRPEKAAIKKEIKSKHNEEVPKEVSIEIQESYEEMPEKLP